MDTLDMDSPEVAVKRDGRSLSSASNGAKFGGMPKGISTPKSTKRTYNPDALAEGLADRIVNGQGIARTPLANAGPVTEYDRAHVARITGVPAEEFQSMISAKLQVIADKATQRVIEKLDGDEQKLSDLNMTLAISIDKLAAISGRTAQAGNVSVTVHNYGAMSRAEMLAQMDAEKRVTVDV